MDVTLTPAADTYVRSGSNAINGSATTLRTALSSSSVVYDQTYIRFDLGTTSGPIRKAILKVFVSNGSKNTADIYSISDTTWSEATTSWNNRPAVDGAKLATLGRTSNSKWYSVDVTAAVAGGSTQVSFALVPLSTDAAVYSSREAGANGPQLVLTMDDPVPDAGTPEDAGTSPPDAGSTWDGGQRIPCVDPLTGVPRAAANIESLTADVFGRIVRTTPEQLCLYGNGHKVDQGHIEPADAYTWTRTYSGQFWEENYHTTDNATDINVEYPIIENIAMYNTGQGVMLREKTLYFAVRDAYIQHAGDDGIESDHLVGGVIDDVLIDKAFAPIAWRMSSSTCWDKPNNVVKINNSILRAFPQYGIYPNWADTEYIPGYATVFKWEKVCQYATKLELTNTIIVANQDGMSTDNLNLNANGNLIRSENNILIWLGPWPYTGTVPPGFTVTNDISIFVNAWHDWFRRHPDIAKPSAEPDLNYSLPPLQ